MERESLKTGNELKFLLVTLECSRYKQAANDSVFTNKQMGEKFHKFR